MGHLHARLLRGGRRNSCTSRFLYLSEYGIRGPGRREEGSWRAKRAQTLERTEEAAGGEEQTSGWTVGGGGKQQQSRKEERRRRRIRVPFVVGERDTTEFLYLSEYIVRDPGFAAA